MKPALLVLADGTHFEGEALGYEGESIGEVVFNTSMSGYQEILTDPSYSGQLVTMTSVHIGNYGVNPWDVESDGVRAGGLIVREASRRAANFRATATLQEYLFDSRTVAISGVDTRAVTRRIRNEGAVMGAIVHDATAADVDDIVARIKAAPDYGSLNFVERCSVKEARRVVLKETGDAIRPEVVEFVGTTTPWPERQSGPDVAVMDYGVKYSILRLLVERGLRVTVYPHNTTAEQLLGTSPDGIMLSNGPGDPARLDDEVNEIRKMLGQKPVFGICLGHQLLGRALGGETFKLKFGHRGPNQPVLDVDTTRVQITAQNHGYAVRFGADAEGIEITHTNLNDGTVEGLRATSHRAFSVQHHPEAGPGPRDALLMFDQFHDEIARSLR